MAALKNLFGIFADMAIWFGKAFIIVIVPFLVSYLMWFIIGLIKGKRVKKRTVKRKSSKYSKPSALLKRLYIDAPRAAVNDVFERDPDDFDTFGVHIFAGEQGSGKSIAMMHFIKQIQERNPACKIASNINIDFQDDAINDWTDILRYNNGKRGQVIVLDEIQNWFSSNESKNFPPEMLTEITQERKQRKIVVGTSQVFNRISKPIREQITLLYKPLTIMGCFTIVRVYRPHVDNEGIVDKLHMVKSYCFVHDDELRGCYNTFEKVARMSVTGFQDRTAQLTADGEQQVQIVVSNKRKKAK